LSESRILTGVARTEYVPKEYSIKPRATRFNNTQEIKGGYKAKEIFKETRINDYKPKEYFITLQQ